MSYKKLEIWKLSRQVVVDLHRMSMQLPKLNCMKQVAKFDDPQNQSDLILLKDMAGGDIRRILSDF